MDMEVRRGEIVGLIGESGAGKSTIGNALMGLLSHPGRVTGGKMQLEDQDLARMSDKELSALRGRRIGMIFQDPMTSLNPLMTIGEQLSETIELLQKVPREEADKHAISTAGGCRYSRTGGKTASISARIFRRHAPAGSHRARSGRRPRSAHR